jgi:LysM repeat protein
MNEKKNRQATRRIAMVVNMFLILAIVWAAFAQTTAASAAACKFKHKVQPGETLIYIGQLYQYDWREIAEANDIKEPYVLTGGQVLCIPGGTKPADTTTTTTTTEEGTTTTTTTKKEPTMTTGASMNSVYIKVEGFPKNTVYYVNIPDLYKYIPRTASSAMATAQAEDVEAKNIDSTRIGRIRTDKNGLWEGWFRIPFVVEQTPQMQVCLKNVMTDSLSCSSFENPHYTYSFSEKVDIGGEWVMVPRSCAKWGR